jgi:hypothetical protein
MTTLMTVPIHPAAKVLATCSSLGTRSRSSRGSKTRREIYRIKREIRELRQLSRESTIVAIPSTLAPIRKSTICFSDPLVTQVTFRPWTLKADIEELYFCMEELEELEWDRETTQADQYECIIQEQSSLSSVANVAIAHKLKRYEEESNEDVAVVTDIQSFCSSDTEIIHYFDRRDLMYV